MFPRRYYAARMFAPRYFSESQGQAPDVSGYLYSHMRRQRLRRRYR